MLEALIGNVGWFNQDHAHEFYVAKGVVSLTATLALISHMVITWENVISRGQRLRYLTLMYLSGLIAFASAEQVKVGETVDYRNLGGMLGAALILGAAVVSIREDHRRRA